MSRPNRTPDPSAALARLRLRLFGASVASVTLLAAAFVLWRLAAGAEPAELLAPLAGATLALAAELLCLDVALRHAARVVAPERTALERGRRGEAMGV